MISELFLQETPLTHVRCEVDVGDRLTIDNVEYRVMGVFPLIPWGDDKFTPGSRLKARIQSVAELAKEGNWKFRLEQEEPLLRTVGPIYENAGPTHRRLITSNSVNI